MPFKSISKPVPGAVCNAAVIAVALLVGGCATGRPSKDLASNGPIESVPLEQLKPPVTLPAPAKTSSSEVPSQALEKYARGRDLLLKNQKPAAIEQLNAAAELDSDSAILFRDLGYAQLGMDDTKAMAAFRRACELDPNDSDSRLQLARLLLAKDKFSDAIEQLRLIRLTPDYAEGNGLTAVVDLLLGQCLEQAHYNTAALQCFENVLAIADDRSYELRGRPELTDLLGRPGVLILRTADLATACGKYDRAIELYQRLQRQEPQSALTLELRLARAELAAGRRPQATKRAFDFVRKSAGSRLSFSFFDELFEPYGGAAAALAELDKLGDAGDRPRLDLLRSHLLLKTGNAAAAIVAVDRIKEVDLPLIRATVHAYRSAGRDDDLVRKLLERTAADAKKYHIVQRGWLILSQLAQPKPLRGDDVLKLSVDPKLFRVQKFIAAMLYANAGRQATADRILAEAQGTLDAPPFDFNAARTSPNLDLADLNEVATPAELAVLIEDYRDDPELLNTTVAEVVREGQQRLALDAFAAVSATRATDPVIASAYAQLLTADDQRAEAGRVLEKAVAAAKSGSELYYLSSQFSGLGDDKAAERVLRHAFELEPNSPSICNDLGYMLTDQGRDLDFAEQLLTNATRLEPDNAAYLDSYGWLLYKRGKFVEAAKQLESAVYFSTPTDPVVLDHAGDALYQAKQEKRAVELWQQAVDAIKQRGTSDPQLRLRVEHKLEQHKNQSPVPVAPVAKAN